jgi:hypothetical protein
MPFYDLVFLGGGEGEGSLSYQYKVGQNPQPLNLARSTFVPEEGWAEDILK